MIISGKTKVIALLGYPVTHSLSPAMQNAAFEDLGLDYCYVTFAVHPDRLANAVQGLRAMEIAGANVTVPHKEAILPMLDEIDPTAETIGAVNTIINRQGRLTGYNTDGLGFMQSMTELGISVTDKRVLIVGAGGAARGIGYQLIASVSALALYNRNHEKALRLSDELNSVRPASHCVTDISNLSQIDVIINATPLGLAPSDPMPVDPETLLPNHTVGDLIYKDTRLLREASRAGCKTFNGMGMLLWQGALAFELWTGSPAPVKAMRNALHSTIR